MTGSFWAATQLRCTALPQCLWLLQHPSPPDKDLQGQESCFSWTVFPPFCCEEKMIYTWILTLDTT